MPLKPVGLPDPLNGAQRDAGRLGNRAFGPVGNLAGRLEAGQGQHLGNRAGGQWLLARWPGRVVQQPFDAFLAVALLPEPQRRTAHAGLPRDLLHRQPLA